MSHIRTFLAVGLVVVSDIAHGADVRVYPLANGEVAATPDGALVTNIGTPIIALEGCTLRKTTSASEIRAGLGGFVANVDTRPRGYTGLGAILHGFAAEDVFHHPFYFTRDLSLVDSVLLSLDNRTGTSFRLKVEIKDFRDSTANSLLAYITIPATAGWQNYSVRLADMQRVGTPDITRVRNLFFVVERVSAEAVGDVCFDELLFREAGPVVESSTASAATIDGILLRRMFIGLYGSRDAATGLIPLNTAYGDVVATNSTAAGLLLLPVAVSSGYITRSKADAWVNQVCTTLSRLRWNHVPPRYLNPRTLQANFTIEESPLDAALLALGLVKWNTYTGGNNLGLTSKINAQLNRFKFSSFFVGGQGFRLKYDPVAKVFDTNFYQDVSGEVWVMSLVAHLVGPTKIPIEQSWNTGTGRVKLLSGTSAFVVPPNTDYRSPFMSWMLPALVDVSTRGNDNFPDAALRVNPWTNAVNYQIYVSSQLSAAGRGSQPDAGIDVLGGYQAFSLWRGPVNLHHPWSNSWVGLSDPNAALLANRSSLALGHHSLLGYSECVQAGVPVGRIDCWNCGLSALALSAGATGGNRVLAADSNVRSALNRVFPTSLPLATWARLTQPNMAAIDAIDASTEGARTAMEFLSPFATKADAPGTAP